MSKRVVALVGRPNVGKSTLFNRIAGERLAVVHEEPGTTRDRLVAEATWRGVSFHIVDTGGVDPFAAPVTSTDAGGSYAVPIREQAERAAAEADAILFIVDVEDGVTPGDHEVARILRRAAQVPRRGSRQPRQAEILLVVNKADNAERRARAVEFYELGLGDPIPVSALHGQGSGDLLDALFDRLRTVPAQAEAEPAGLPIAILGRPNVGKSSLLNRLLGEDRVIVSPQPGTTRDAVDTHLTFHGTPVTLIDTAGLRRRGRVAPGVEQYSVLRALRALDRADVVLVVLDAVEGIAAQDAHIAGLVLDKGKSVIAVVNKWDAVPKIPAGREVYTAQVRERLRFLDYVPVLFVSAKTGQRVGEILPLAFRVHEARRRRIPDAALQQVVMEAVDRHPPPGRGSRALRIASARQVRDDPPTFLFRVNDPKLVHFSYSRFLENCLRERFGFLGTPLRLSFRARARPRRASR